MLPADLTSSGIELIPILQRAIGTTSHKDPETVVFAIRLCAVFQSQCTIYTTDLVRQICTSVDAFYYHDSLLVEILKFFAHMVDYVSFYDSKIVLEQLLRGNAFQDVTTRQPECHGLLDKIHSRLIFVPISGPAASLGDYPDLRTYQDMQFSSLGTQPREQQDQALRPTFEPSNWEMSNTIE